MTKRTVEIEDNLQEIIDSAKSDVADVLVEWLVQNHDHEQGEPDVPCLSNDLDYSGSVHEIIDSSVPIYTGEITDLWYLYGDDFEQAFDDAGIGSKDDEGWPAGWKAAAIYCYIEQQVHEWYHEEAEEIVAQWWEETSE